MLTDPTTLTINANAVPLPRTTSGTNTSVYTKADGTMKLTISHTMLKNKRVRTMVRLDEVKVAADPYMPTTNKDVNHFGYIVFDRKINEFTSAQIANNFAGLATWLTASSNANLLKVLGWES